MPSEGSHIGVGLYPIADAARITGVHPSSVLRWIDVEHGIVHRAIDPRQRLLTFRELMEIQFIHIFHSQSVPLRIIREISEKAAKRYGTYYPLSARRFDTDGKTLFETLIKQHKNGRIVEDLRRGQLVFDPIIRPFFKKLEYRRTNELARFWPLEKTGRVVLDPVRKFGQPIDAASGVTTRSIYEATLAGGGQDWKTVAHWLDIPVSAVEAAVTFEQRQAA